MSNKLKKLEKYVHEQKIGANNWFVLNLLNFNYIIADEPLSALSIESISDSTKNNLRKLGFLTESTENHLFKKYAKRLENEILSINKTDSDTIDFLIVPTLGCNFRCSYCYQPDLYGSETRDETEFISLPILESLFDYIKNSQDMKNKNINLRICGGEIFLDDKRAFDFVERLIQLANKFPVEEILFVTNGYNIDRYLHLLTKFKKNIIYTITIDGPAHIHNAKRFLENRDGTFAKIIDNIQLIVEETEHFIGIRTNFDNHNIDYYDEFLTHLKSNDLLKSKQLSLYIRLVYEYSSVNNKTIPEASVSNRKKIMKLILDLFFEKKFSFNFKGAPGILPLIIGDLLLGEHAGQEPNTYSNPLNMFCSAKQGLFSAIDYDGKIFPCYANEAQEIGTIYPKVNIDKEFSKKWNSLEFNRNEFYKEPCRDCKYFFMCSLRQCPFSAFYTYDENKNYCNEIFENIYYFIDYFGENVWKNLE